MFIRTKHDAKLNRTRIQIVESVRTGSKVRQKILRHVGVAHNDSEIEDIKRLAGRLMEQLRIDRSPQMELFTPTEYADLQALVRRAPRPDKLGVDLAECREEARVSLGLRDVMGTMYDQLGWGALLGAARKSANRIVKELVMARIAQPESKRATVEALENQAGITLNLDVVYRSMDYINTPVIDGICKTSHAAAEKLLGGPVTVLFYDCTTLAFDTEREDPAEDADGVEQDHLLAKGFSKDGKHHRAQVMLALIVTSDGLPVGYELFPGNTWEGFIRLEAAHEHHSRDATRWPGSRSMAAAAMLSKDKPADLAELWSLPYILGYRMKSAPAAVKANILSTEGRQPWAGHGSEEATEKSWYKVIDQEGARVIVTWSPTRARNDAHKRFKAIDEAAQDSSSALANPADSASGDMAASWPSPTASSSRTMMH